MNNESCSNYTGLNVIIEDIMRNVESFLFTPPSNHEYSNELINVQTKTRSREIPNYPVMVREAIASINMNAGTNGYEQLECSKANIILYILSRYKPPENITVVYEKVLTALGLLERLDVVERYGMKQHDGMDSSLEFNDYSNSRAQTSPSLLNMENFEGLSNKHSIEIKKTANRIKHLYQKESNTTGIVTNTCCKSKGSKMTNGLPKSTNCSKFSVSIPDHLEPKVWIGIKSNGNTKKLYGSHIPATEKPIKANKTKFNGYSSNSMLNKANELIKKSNDRNHVMSKKDKKQSENISTSRKAKKMKGSNKDIRSYTSRQLSPELAAICGSKQLPHNNIVSRIWKYINQNNLRDPHQKKIILCDEKFQTLTKRSSISIPDILSYISSHTEKIS